ETADHGRQMLLTSAEATKVQFARTPARPLPGTGPEKTEGPPPQRGPSAARILNRSRLQVASPNGDTSSGNEDRRKGHGCTRATRDGQGARRRGQGNPRRRRVHGPHQEAP